MKNTNRYKNIQYKNIFICFFIFLFSTACGNFSKKNNRRQQDEHYKAKQIQTNQNSGTSVLLKAHNKGIITFINFTVTIPNKSKNNLLDYNGSVNLNGTLQATNIACLNKKTQFKCNQATISVGNIHAVCSIQNHNNIRLTISLFRGQEIQTTYSIAGITLDAPPSCFNNNLN